jgi:glucose 1-dehydrogenase
VQGDLTEQADGRRLQGKVTLVTGSSRGIGRAIAIRYAREGADVVVNYHHDAEGAHLTRGEVEAVGGRACIIQADVSRVSAVREMMAKAIEHFGKLDVLVNNAGVMHGAPFWEATEEDFDRVLSVDLKGPFFAIQAFVQHLLATQRPGKVINISSVHEDLPFPNFASYCAAKGGLRTLMRTLAIELGRFGITVNAIAPGAIQTALNTRPVDDFAQRPALLEQIPLGRLGQPEDVAALAAFLASADADYITGASYLVDGGLAWYYRE